MINSKSRPSHCVQIPAAGEREPDEAGISGIPGRLRFLSTKNKPTRHDQLYINILFLKVNAVLRKYDEYVCTSNMIFTIICIYGNP